MLLQQRSSILYNDDEKLEGIAKQAKERLDERLGALYRKSQPKRYYYYIYKNNHSPTFTGIL